MEHIIVVETAKSIDEACQALEQSVTDHKFGVMHIHNVRQTLANKGYAFDREVRIFDVCNPQQAKKVLEENILMSSLLPCSISVFTEGERTKFAFVKPTIMLRMFGSEELRPVAEEVEDTVRRIVETAAGE